MNSTQPVANTSPSQPLTSASNMPITTKKKTPWGLFIGLILILAIIVAGAYYAFTERTAAQIPTPTASGT